MAHLSSSKILNDTQLPAYDFVSYRCFGWKKKAFSFSAVLSTWPVLLERCSNFSPKNSKFYSSYLQWKNIALIFGFNMWQLGCEDIGALMVYLQKCKSKKKREIKTYYDWDLISKWNYFQYRKKYFRVA